MLLIKYYFWVTLYHLSTFYLMMPTVFLRGIILLPYWVLKSLSSPIPDEVQVTNGLAWLKTCWDTDAIPHPPKFIKQRLLKLV